MQLYQKQILIGIFLYIISLFFYSDTQKQKQPTENLTIFDKIIRKQIPSTIVYQDREILAFRDINPQAPVHIILIPKDKNGLISIANAQQKHQEILGKLMVAVAKVAKIQNLNQGYRVVINDGKHGGQSVQHLHVHLLGGKQFTWPPGTSQ